MKLEVCSKTSGAADYLKCQYVGRMSCTRERRLEGEHSVGI
jgi:hypothetical protein